MNPLADINRRMKYFNMNPPLDPSRPEGMYQWTSGTDRFLLHKVHIQDKNCFQGEELLQTQAQNPLIENNE
jgi:hypothetical protein